MTPYPISKQVLGLLAWLVVCFAAAALGAMASVQAGDFYQALVRPVWAPPGWLFGPVWTVLYCLMAVSAWLVWRAQGFGAARTALLLFLFQLAVNSLWTWLFFAWRMGALAFAEIIFLWALIVATMLLFGRHRRAAAVLLIPYLAWVSLATGLTWAVWQNNPLVLG